MSSSILTPNADPPYSGREYQRSIKKKKKKLSRVSKCVPLFGDLDLASPASTGAASFLPSSSKNIIADRQRDVGGVRNGRGWLLSDLDSSQVQLLRCWMAVKILEVAFVPAIGGSDIYKVFPQIKGITRDWTLGSYGTVPRGSQTSRGVTGLWWQISSQDLLR